MAGPSDYTPVIRELWPQSRIEQRFFKNSPVLAKMPRSKDFAEVTKHIAVKYGIPQGGSHTASTAIAQGAAAASKFSGFSVTIAEDFQVGTLDDLTLERGKVKKAAIVDALESEIGGMIDNLSARMSFEIHRSGAAARGRVGTSGITTSALTLATKSDVYNFEVGQQIVISDTETGALRDSGDYVTIIAINPVTGVLTGDSSWATTISGATDADYLFVRGDSANGGSVLGLRGLAAWNPYSTPAALFGVTRTTHRDRLAGISYDGSGQTSVKQAVLKLCTQIHLASRGMASGGTVILHPNNYDSLLIDLQSAVRYTESGSTVAGVYFKGVTLSTALGELDVLPDPYAPEGYARVVNFEHFKLDGLGEMPHIVQNDGQRVTRQASAFGVEFRAVWRAQAVCEAPITMGVALLP